MLSNNSSSLRKKCDRNFFLLTPCIPSALIIKGFSGKYCGDTALLFLNSLHPEWDVGEEPTKTKTKNFFVLFF